MLLNIIDLEIIIFVLLKIRSAAFLKQLRMNVQSIVSFGSRSDNREFVFPREHSRRCARSHKLLTLEAHLSKSNNTFNIDDSRPIFAPTDKPSDNP